MTRRAAITIVVIRSSLPLLLFMAFAAWMLIDWRRDPYDPALTGTQVYGHNAEGSLGLGLGFSVAELLAYYVLTCPFLMRRPRWFFVIPLLGIFGLAGWTFVSMVLTMHSGGILLIHLFWLFAIGIALVVETVLSVVSAWTGRQSAGGKPATPAT